MTLTIFGIKNCDTMKKAFKWLDAAGIDYEFHDYKKTAISPEKLESWCNNTDWETLLNKRGTTFRRLPDEDKQGLDQHKAIALMIANPSMIKRPVLEAGSELLVGFSPKDYARILD